MEFLQIEIGEPSEAALSVWDLAVSGGWMMLPIALCSLVSVYVIVERLLAIRKANTDPGLFMKEIRDKVMAGDIAGAERLCAQSPSPVAVLIGKGVSRIGSPLKNIEASIESEAKIELFRLEKNIPLLATVSGAAPMMGFLGTVIGMVQAFMAIAQEEGSISPKLLSSGIYTAMITTVAGLVVGIVAYLGYNYLVARIAQVVHKMEYSSIEFIDLLQETKQP